MHFTPVMCARNLISTISSNLSGFLILRRHFHHPHKSKILRKAAEPETRVNDMSPQIFRVEATELHTSNFMIQTRISKGKCTAQFDTGPQQGNDD